jgi:S1-C subfamily serine protease
MSVKELDEFVFNLHLSSEMPYLQSFYGLIQNVVQLRLYSENFCLQSNGLMITENGYVITARHCIEPLMRGEVKYSKVISENSTHSIERVCLISQDHDFALIKMNNDGAAGSQKFKLNPHSLYDSNMVALLTKRDGFPEVIPGNFLSSEFNGIFDSGQLLNNQFSIEAGVLPGHSGSPVINEKGELMGLVSATAGRQVSCVKMRSILEEIVTYSFNN